MTAAAHPRPAIWRRAVAVVALAVVAGATHVGVTAAPAEAADSPRDIILRMTNNYRENHDRNPVRTRAGAQEVATDWSKTMRRTRTLRHNPDYAELMPGNWTRVAENVGYACGHGNRRAAARAIVNAWKKSPDHARNMRGNYWRIGIGFAYDKNTDCAWATQNFIKY